MYSLPGSEVKKWIDSNDAEVGLTELRITDDEIHVPEHIYFDSLQDSKLVPLRDGQSTVVYGRSDLQRLQKIRRNSYHACRWYPEIHNVIPTAPGVLVSLDESEETVAEQFQKLSFGGKVFVRLCNMSPKDLGSCVFQSIDDAYQALERSERTRDRFLSRKGHLFLREPREYVWEARCFWSKGQLRAVSLPPGFPETDREEILDFFETYGPDIPYHSAVVDIGKTTLPANGIELSPTRATRIELFPERLERIELIEFNSFGPDLLATAGNFSWYEDCELLLNSKDVIFR